MALHTIEFEVKLEGDPSALPSPVHYGVVGSGDLEVLMEPAPKGGAVSVRIVTPVGGFDHLWRRVVDHFVAETRIGDVNIEINDNNASPAVVAMRLRQALGEASV